MIPIKKTKIILVLLVIVNILVYSVYAYLFILLEDNTRETNALSLKIGEQQRRENVKGIIEKSLEGANDNFYALKDYIVKEDGEIDFIKEIEIIASDLNLQSEIKSVNLEEIKDIKSIETMKMSIDVIGKWSSVYNFLRKLEALPFDIKLDKVSMERFSEEDAKGGKLVMWLGHFEFSLIKLKSK